MSNYLLSLHVNFAARKSSLKNVSESGQPHCAEWAKVRLSTRYEPTLHYMITATANENQKRLKKIRTNANTLVQLAIWMTDEIRDGIKKRKDINREKRYLEEEEKKLCWERYLAQKKKVSELIREEIRKYESFITNEIKESKDGYKKMWKHIDRLKGVNKQEKKSKVYGDDKKIVEGEDLKRNFMDTWSPGKRFIKSMRI